MKQLPEPERNDRPSKAPARYQYIEVPPPEASAELERDGLLDYWRILCRHKGTIFLFAVCGVLTALLFSLSQTPVYQARTTLEILDVNENVLNTRDLDPTASGNQSPELTIQTQVKVLQSRTLVESVLKKIHGRNATQIAGDTTRISAWRDALGLGAPQPPSEEQLVRSALSHLKVQALARTRLVEVSYDSTDAESAARFLNQLAGEFIDRNVEVRWEAAQKTGDWLTRQLEDLKIKLEKAEDQLQTYARAEGLQFTSETENVAEEKLKQVQQELSNAQAARVVMQSRHELVSRAAAESLPEILDDRALGDYQAKLTELRRQHAELTSTLTPAHYKVKRVEAQIETLETAFNRQRANVLARIKNEYETAKRREKLLAKDYAAQSSVVSEQAQRTIHYSILKREVDTQRQLYEAMLQKVKEYGIASAMHASNVRVVDPAQPPRFPYKPNYPVNSALGMVSGLLLGVMFVVVRERADRSIQAPGDAALYLDLPELGVIPCVASARRLLGYYRRQPVAIENTGNAVELMTARKSPSPVAESFRAVLASILFTGKNGDRPRVIVLTSPSPKEGKTTVVSNLGLALGEIGQRVLLIDADMRKPRLHQIFGISNDWGLSDVIQCKPAPDDRTLAVCETSYPGLYVLPSGPEPAGASSLLYSARVAEILREFRNKFDMVLIDTPPMLTMPDARVVGRLADAVIVVIRAKQTMRDMAQAAIQRFTEDGTRVMGTVLNDWDPNASSSGYYGYKSHYGYYYHKDSGAQ